MPRRKYGRMVKAFEPIPVEKCRSCRLNHPCPLHDPKDRPDYEELARLKRWRKTGKRKRKKRVKPGGAKQS